LNNKIIAKTAGSDILKSRFGGPTGSPVALAGFSFLPAGVLFFIFTFARDFTHFSIIFSRINSTEYSHFIIPLSSASSNRALKSSSRWMGLGPEGMRHQRT